MVMAIGPDLVALELEPPLEVELGTFAESEDELSMDISALGTDGAESDEDITEEISTEAVDNTLGLSLSTPGCDIV